MKLPRRQFLHLAAGAKPELRGIASANEIKERLSALMRGHDPALALRAASDLAKLVEPEPDHRGGHYENWDGYDGARWNRDLLLDTPKSPVGPTRGTRRQLGATKLRQERPRGFPIPNQSRRS